MENNYNLNDFRIEGEDAYVRQDAIRTITNERWNKLPIEDRLIAKAKNGGGAYNDYDEYTGVDNNLLSEAAYVIIRLKEEIRNGKQGNE